jgi:tetratricopeptide (TPR) repeat protein
MTPKDPELLAGEAQSPGLTGGRGRSPSEEVPMGPGFGHGSGCNPVIPAEPPAADPEKIWGEVTIYERVSDLLERGRLHDAENLLFQGLEIYPESVDLLKELGVLYQLQGRYGKAARTFTRVMNITGEGKQSLSWRIAALSHKALEEFRGPDPGLSLLSFDEILTLDPSDREAIAGRIAALRALGRLDEAERWVEKGLSLSPPGPSISYQEGWLHMDRDRPDLASGAFERASRGDPSWPDPVLSRALSLVRLGRAEEGERLLRESIDTRRELAGLQAGLGWFSLAIHNPGKAREIFLELARREGDPGGFHGLAAVLLATGRAGEAGYIMGRLSLAFPGDLLLQVNHGMILARTGGARELADAAVAAKRALSLDPRFAPAHTCLGIIAFKEGRLEAAEAHLTDAARLSDPGGERNLGLLACARGRWEEAEPRLLRAIRLDPLDGRAWAGLGAVALQGDRSGEAILNLRRASTLDPRDAGAARGLTIALARTGDMIGAEEVIRRTMGLAPESDRWILLLDLSAVLVRRGEAGGNPVLDEEARQLLGKAAALRPDDPGIVFFRALAEGRLGHLKEAIDHFASITGDESYGIPAHENIRRLREHARSRRGSIARMVSARSALAVLSLLQLAAIWLFFGAGLVSEGAFVLILAILLGLFSLALFMPARKGEERREVSIELVIPERTFIPSPEADMVSPLFRLRTALRP